MDNRSHRGLVSLSEKSWTVVDSAPEHSIRRAGGRPRGGHRAVVRRSVGVVNVSFDKCILTEILVNNRFNS